MPDIIKRISASQKKYGAVTDGDWDNKNRQFDALDVYDAFLKRVNEKKEWRETEYYRRILSQVKSGDYVYGIRTEEDLIERTKYLDSLYECIKTKGYLLNRDNCEYNVAFDEIQVAIGRNGEYILKDGIHRLSIAKIIGVESVPVTVFVRHKKWQDIRNFVYGYAKDQLYGGKLYQPITHPDFVDIPYDALNHDYNNLMESLTRNLGKENGTLLDIGANTGFWSFKFEDLGYHCYAVERDPTACQIMEKMKIANNKKFTIINKSIFDLDLVKEKKFDVVLALSCFHHFLKTKNSYFQFIDLLKNLKTNELFFEPHKHNETQMREAYANYTETQFVDFVSSHTSLSNSEMIFTDINGRHVFKLTK